MGAGPDSEPDRQPIDVIVARWRRATRTERRLIYVLGIWIGLIALAWIVASVTWRGDLPRSTIAIVTLVLMALAALLVVGAGLSRALVAVLAAAATIGAVGGGALNSEEILPDGPPPPGAVVDCPGGPSDARFDGVVADTELGYTHLREGPGFSRIMLRYPSGCRVHFDAYCFGDPKADWRFGTPDPVWYELADGDGYVASADLQTAPPPQGVPTADCPAGDPSPQPAEITSPTQSTLSGPVEIAAASPDAVIVGFAVYYEDVPDEPASARWHQIGLDTDTGDGITSHWDTRSVPGQGRHLATSATIAAVNCQGLEFPMDGVGSRGYAIVNRTPKSTADRAVHARLVSAESAMDVACLNPQR